LAALNAVPYGPYVTPEQAAFIALRSNATLADETLADFNALWDADETAFAETETDVETLSVVAESLAFESLDLGEIEQEPLPGDASLMSGSTGNSGGGDITVTTSGGNAVASGALAFATDAAISEDDEEIVFYFYGGSSLANTTISASVTGVDSDDYSLSETLISLNEQGFGSFTFQSVSDDAYEGDEVATITLSASGTATLSQSVFTVTIVDAPEFISPADATANNSTVVNEDVFQGEFLDTSNIALGSAVALYSPTLHSAHSVTYTWTVEGIGAGALHLDESTGVVTYNAESANEKYGSVVAYLTVAYDGNSAFSDTIRLNLKWADVSQAQLSAKNCRDETYGYGLNYLWGTETCLRFANDLEIELQELKQTDANFSIAANATMVYFTLDDTRPWYLEFTTGHSAIEIVYGDGTVLYYDNGGLADDGVFTLEEIPSYAHLLN
ncbi:MAG: hypothetical protein IJE97_15410, partial [Thermoguttaceae bacterium]|nr:hypothetical protein [Thermoguttaceae bacterium]